MMSSTTIYKQGDIVLVPFPFTDFSTFKQRPALVLSSHRFNRAQEDLIVAAITSYLNPSKMPYEYRLTPAEQTVAGLPKPSAVKLGKIITLDHRLIRRRLGSLPPQSTNRIRADLQKIFDQ